MFSRRSFFCGFLCLVSFLLVGCRDTAPIVSAHVTSISFRKTSDTIIVNKSILLVATIEPANAIDQTVSWESSDPNVASVSDTGLVTGISIGIAEITVTSKDQSKKAKCKVIVDRVVTTVAGTGDSGLSGDNGPATLATISPDGIAVDAKGNVYFGCPDDKIRKIDTNGIITTIAGNGSRASTGDGGNALDASLCYPTDVAIDSYGCIYISEFASGKIRKISEDGIITTIAGTGVQGFSGDGGQAISAQLNYPCAIDIDSVGNIFIADSHNNRIRKIDTSGIISTIAGDGSLYGYYGDGGPGISAALGSVSDVSVDSFGNVYIADGNNGRIRKLDTNGIITTVAGKGNGMTGVIGDGGMATSAEIIPCGVTVDLSGNIYIVDRGNNRIRKVDIKGIITTIAGNGIFGYSGDGDAATIASININAGNGIAIGPTLDVFFTTMYRIRKITN